MISFLITDNHLVLKIKECSEILVGLKKIRLACPCAHCKGEKDVFGNVYKLELDNPLLENSFKVSTIKPVGNYGIRIFWEDGHSNGIYTFNALKKISE